MSTPVPTGLDIAQSELSAEFMWPRCHGGLIVGLADEEPKFLLADGGLKVLNWLFQEWTGRDS